jgi:predicted transcriptional regulator
VRWLKEVKLAREEHIWALRIKGYTQMRIAAELGIHQGTVSKILQRVSTRVAQQMHEEIAQRKAEQVAQLEHIAQEAMDARERSKVTATAIQQRTAAGDHTTVTYVTAQVGAPRYLHTAMDALAEIRQVLDMEKVPLVGEGGTLILKQTQQPYHVLVIRGR